MPETKILIIEPDREESDRATQWIQRDYPDSVITVVASMSEAAHELDGGEFDLVLYSPMSFNTIGGKTSPLKEIASYLSKYQVPVIAISPQAPPLYVKRAIDSVPGVEFVTHQNFHEVLALLAEIAKKKSGGTAHRVEVGQERLQAKIEGALAQLAEARTAVKAIETTNWQQEQAFIEVRNQLNFLTGSITELKQSLAILETKVGNLSSLTESGERESKIAIARLDANSKKQIAAVSAMATAIVGFLSLLGTPTVKEFIERVLPARHQEAPPQPTKTPPKKNG